MKITTVYDPDGVPLFSQLVNEEAGYSPPGSYAEARLRLTIAIDEAKQEISCLLLPRFDELIEEMTAAVNEYMRIIGRRYQVALAAVLLLLTLVIGMAT